MKYLYTWLLLCLLFTQCNFKTNRHNDIVLSSFSKELISLFIEEELIAYNSDDSVICIESFSNSSGFYLNIESDDVWLCRHDSLGEIVFENIKLIFYGEKENIFFQVDGKIPEIKGDCFCEYNKMLDSNPTVWSFHLHRDTAFDKMSTSKSGTIGNDIATIEQLAMKYFKLPNSIPDKLLDSVYLWFQVETTPEFYYGEDSLNQVISLNLNLPEPDKYASRTISATILVDRNGNASPTKDIFCPKDSAVYNEVLRVIEIVCSYKFKPAIYRGEVVSCTKLLGIKRSQPIW